MPRIHPESFTSLPFLMGVAMLLGPCLVSKGQQALECTKTKIVAPFSTEFQQFGYPVELHESFLFVASPLSDVSETGRVHIFQRGVEPGSWLPFSTLLGSIIVPGEAFGIDLNLDLDRLIVAASNDEGASVGSGAAFTFVYNPVANAWQSEDKFFGLDGVEQDQVVSVAVSGNLALIGSPFHSHGGIESGAVYAFHFDGSTWTQEAELLNSDRANIDRFGWSVDLHGDTAVILALLDDALGSVIVFKRIAGTWVETGKIFGPDGGLGGPFGGGSNLDFDGTTLAVGVPLHESGGPDVGAVYLFEDDGTPDWLFIEKLLPPLSSDNLNDRFGMSVDIDDDRLAVGASPVSKGSGHIYRFDGTDWNHVIRLTMQEGTTSGVFGGSIAINLDTVVISNPYDAETNGSAFVYRDIFIDDCNQNCIDDLAELADGTAFDCNANGLLDQCDLTNLTSVDCNNNLIPDDCEDCNGNGQADECELSGLWVVNSPQLGPIGLGSTVSHTFIDPRTALSDVTLDLSSNADLQGSFKYIDLYLNDDYQGRIFNGASSEGCPPIPELDVPEFDQVMILMDDYNALVGAGDATFRFEADTFLATACVDPSWVQFTMSYTGPPTTPDVNVNGVPDSCDLARGDNNLDGVVNVDDLLNLLAKWGTCGSPCPEDSDLDGDVDVEDLLSLLAGWG
ncbi:MAG: hypothetical protein O7G85_09680 [Planctomycetota bacterium]|nr:hypothetical protein [Planctomycetota bacterium]